MQHEYDIPAQKLRQMRWDVDFLLDAVLEARRSKDPSTKVGAIIVRPDMTTASRGYNGFARGVLDTPERLHDRAQKYPRVVHGEANAIVTAREPLHGYTLYCTHVPCSDGHNCAGLAIQAGIKRVVTVQPSEDMLERWRSSFAISEEMFAEAGVEFQTYPMFEVENAMRHYGISIKDTGFLSCGCCAPVS